MAISAKYLTPQCCCQVQAGGDIRKGRCLGKTLVAAELTSAAVIQCSSHTDEWQLQRGPWLCRSSALYALASIYGGVAPFWHLAATA